MSSAPSSRSETGCVICAEFVIIFAHRFRIYASFFGAIGALTIYPHPIYYFVFQVETGEGVSDNCDMIYEMVPWVEKIIFWINNCSSLRYVFQAFYLKKSQSVKNWLRCGNLLFLNCKMLILKKSEIVFTSSSKIVDF